MLVIKEKEKPKEGRIQPGFVKLATPQALATPHTATALNSRSLNRAIRYRA